MTDIKQTVDEVLTLALNTKLAEFKGQSLNKANCLFIFQAIFDTLVEVIEGSNIPLTNEAMNLVAQDFYDSVRINQTHQLDPSVFSQRAKLENIASKELATLCVVLQGSRLGLDIAHELKRRG